MGCIFVIISYIVNILNLWFRDKSLHVINLGRGER